MRTFSFSSGDSGDTVDKAVITASRRVPTTKRAGGNTGDKFTSREPGSCLAALSPVSNARVGTRRDAVFMGLSPPSPVVPTKTRLKPCHGGKLCSRHEGGRFTMKRGGNVREQSRVPGPADCLRTRQAPRGLPDVRHRAGNDQAHTHAAARFVLFELRPVLHGRARAFDRTGIRRRARADFGLDSAAKSK